MLKDIGGVGIGSKARAGFEAAATIWSSVLSTNTTVRLNVGFQPLASGLLGSTSSASSTLGYSAVRDALVRRATSATDASAAASLAPTLSFISNERGNCTTGVGCSPIAVASRTLDNDNTRDNNYLSVSNSVAKALGLASDNGLADASITFSTAFAWDFDRSNGITSRTYDFVGIAAHEIGHALGFVSGVDKADASIGQTGLDSIAWGTVLDLFRYQSLKRDWTVGGKPCFSIDAGAHCVGLMSTGVINGDHRQASHWKDNLGIGLLDPTAVTGEFLAITQADLIAFDAIGWDVGPSANPATIQWGSATRTEIGADGALAAVPEPGAGVALLTGLGLLGVAARRRRTQPS